MESDSHTLSTALLIEDFPLLATAFQEALRSQYARIIHAQNHERAVELVTTNPVDRPFAVALLHERICTGPDGGQSDGFSLALLLREHSP